MWVQGVIRVTNYLRHVITLWPVSGRFGTGEWLILDPEEFIFDAGGGHVIEAGRTVQQFMLYDAFV